MTTKFDGKSKMDYDSYVSTYEEAFQDLFDEEIRVDEDEKVEFFLKNIEDPNFKALGITVTVQRAVKTSGFIEFNDVTTWMRNRAIDLGYIRE